MNINELCCGDSLDLIDQLNQTPKLVILHPPDQSETPYDLPEYKNFLRTIYTKCFDRLDPNGVLVSINTDRRQKGIYTKHIDIYNIMVGQDLFDYKIWQKSIKGNLYVPTFAHVLCYRKSKKNTNNRLPEYFPDVWLLERDLIKGYSHKDAFPSELVRRLILNFTNPNDLVLDPFVGSGKTAREALKTDRHFIGFDIDPANIELANKYIRS